MDIMDRLIDEFVKLNKHRWSEVKNSKYKICIEGFLNVPNYIAAAATIAQAINDLKNYEPIVIINGNLKEKTEVKKVFESYGIKKYLDIGKYKFNVVFLLKALIATLKVCIQNPNLDKFMDYEVNNIKIGDLIYDTYIRSGNRYSKVKLRGLSFLKEVLKSHIIFYLYTQLVKKHNFRYVILSHRVYVSDGMLARIVIKNGSKVIISRITSVRCYYSYNEIFTDEFKPSKELIRSIINKQLYKKIDSYLKERFTGNIEQHDVINAYRSKKLYSTEELCRNLRLNPSFPIVFMMPHVFSDAPHSNEYMLFRDYYQWFIETIKYINTIKNVNWVIKPHPSSYMYNETGEVERIMKELELDNVHLAPSDLNTASIFNISKTVITVSGTVGIEAACLGIKPIIAGRAIYSNFGIACEPKDKSEYFSTLKNIHSITPLNEQEIITAKAILYWHQIGAFPDSTILPKKGILPSPDPKVIKRQKEESYKVIIEDLKNNNPKNDPYYLCIKKMIKENKKYLTTII